MQAEQASITRLNAVNLATYILNVIVTYGSQAGWFGATNKEQSLKYQTLATPIGFAFAICMPCMARISVFTRHASLVTIVRSLVTIGGPIFMLQAVFAVVQLLPKFRADSVVTNGVSYWYVAVCTAQAGWTIAFAQDVVWLSMVFMLFILASLGLLVRSVTVVAEAQPESTLCYTCFRAPFLLHLGWITAASFVNANT